MSKEQKTLKSPLSAKYVKWKAKVALEAQKSLAREVSKKIKKLEFHLDHICSDLYELQKLMNEILK